MKYQSLLSITIVDAASQKVAGGFCSTRDAVSEEEIAALDQLRRLRQRAGEVKSRLEQASDEDRPPLEAELAMLRQEATQWREKREQATLAKNRALGHVVLALDG